MTINKKITKEEKEALFSDFRNDSDIYETKDNDIVRIIPKNNFEYGHKPYNMITKKEYEERVKQIFSVKI